MTAFPEGGASVQDGGKNAAASRPRMLKVGLFCAFAGMGGTASLIPATIPLAALNADSPTPGYLAAVPALFLGLLAGVVFSAVLLRATTATFAVTIGSLLQFAALLTIGTAPDGPTFAIAAGVAGVGFGLCEASGSIVARALAGQQTTGLLSALTGTVALVAAGSPLLIVAAPFSLNAFQLISALAFGHVVTVAIFIIARRRERKLPDTGTAGCVRPAQPATLAILLAPVAAALFLFVGVETVFAGWSAVISAGALGLPATVAPLGTSAFWVLMAAGRFGVWLILKTGVRPAATLVTNCAVASGCFAAACVLRDGSPSAALFATAAAIVCLGPLYSLILGVGLVRVDLGDAKKAVGLLVACGAAGGAVVPASLLAVDSGPGSPAVFLAAAILTAVVAVLAVTPRRAPARQPM
jgi:fucose permease